MIERKKKLRIIQFTLIFFAIFLIYFTYYNKDTGVNETIISNTTKEKVKEQNENRESFVNIEYTGLDLGGNRYILKSKKAYLDELNPEIIYMNAVNAVFYFKDDTVLRIWSDKGVYNNKTLDMKFTDNVFMSYEDNSLNAKSAEYSNSGGFLQISESVKINSDMGKLSADKLYFDLKKQKLDISSFNNDNVKANITIDEKRF